MLPRRMSMANSLPIASLILLACHLLSPSSATPTAPAFVWSNYRSVGLHTHEVVDYRVLSPEALVDMLMQKFGWSSLLCNSDSGETERLDIVVAFISNKFYSEDVARDVDVESSPVLKIVKDHFMSSSYSLALPYVSVSEERGGILTMLLSTIKDSCNLESRAGKTIVLGSCLKGTFDPKSPIMTEGIEIVDTARDVKDFLLRRKTSREAHETDIILTCPTPINGPKEGESEEGLLASVLSTLHQSGTSSVILYASDPLRPLGGHHRLLSSNSTTCDDICETIAGVYEGVIVAITLLIILISGLCCMMGIDTPSRFERSQDQ